MISVMFSSVSALVLSALSSLSDSMVKGFYSHYKMIVGGVNKLTSVAKSISYECGFIDMNLTANTYTLQFYVIGLSFMLFDLEILLMIPFTFVGFEVGAGHLMMGSFFMLVALVTYYEVLGSVVSLF